MMAKFSKVMFCAALAGLGLTACNDDNEDFPIVGGGNSPSVTLTISDSSIDVGGSAVLSWISSNADSCVASGSWQTPGTRPTTSPFGGESTGVRSVAGTYSYVLTCNGPGGSASDVVDLLVGSTAAPTVSLNLSPKVIQPGSTSSLTWTTTNATACEASGSWTGSRPTASAAAESTGAITIVGSYQYTLTCSGPGGTVSDSETLIVGNTSTVAPVVDISANPTSIAPGGTSTLSWVSSDPAATCVASGGFTGSTWPGSRPPNSPEGGVSTGVIADAGTYSFTLTCTNAIGPGNDTVQIVVGAGVPAPTVTLAVSPDVVAIGEGGLLNWSSTNASSCTASGSWDGARAITGTNVSTGILTTAGVYSYVLTCTGPGGSTAAVDSLTVTGVTKPAVTFTADPFVFSEQGPNSPGTTTLTWSTVAATECTAFGDWSGEKATSGSQSIGPLTVPGTYRYALTCVNNTTGESTIVPIQITVTPLSNDKPKVTIFANPLKMPKGGTTVLSWTASNNSLPPCQASGDWSGARTLVEDYFPVTLPNAGIYNFVLTCSNAAGSARSGVLINVTEPPVVTITAADSTIDPSDHVTLSWSTSDPEASCFAFGGSPTGEWAGPKSDSGSGETFGPVNYIGTHSYGLACTNANGTGIGTVEVEVAHSPLVSCGTVEPSVALLSPYADAQTGTNGLCIGCSVTDEDNVIDDDLTNSAAMSTLVGVVGSVGLRVTDTTGIHPAGGRAGFIIAAPDFSLLSLDLIADLTLYTLLDGTIQDVLPANSLLNLDLLGLLSDPTKLYLSMVTTKPFNAIQLSKGALVGALSTTDVYAGCVGLPPPAM